MLSTPKVMSDDCRTACGRHLREIVAIECDVQRADRNIHAVDAAHGASNALGQRNAAAADADQRQAARAAAFFDDLVGEALQGAVDFGRGHQLRFFDDAHVRVMLAQVWRSGSVEMNLKRDSRRG